VTSLAAPPCDRVAPPTGLPACQWRRRPSSSPRPATRISIGRSTARRSSPIRSRSARYCTAMLSQTEVIAAGLLHDVLEKTATTSRQLRRRFGARIARLVESVSDDPSIGDYEKRKRPVARRLAPGESEALAIFAADKISKVRELALLPRWRLYETTIRAKLTHYQASLEMLRRGAGLSPSSIVSTPSSTGSFHRRSPGRTAPERSRPPHTRSAVTSEVAQSESSVGMTPSKPQSLGRAQLWSITGWHARFQAGSSSEHDQS
jgi:hypothetical protein